MNTQNVNVKTATPEPSGRCGLNSQTDLLTNSQIFDLAAYVMRAGRETGELSLPDLPTDAEEFTASMDGSPDSMTVWILNGWPIAASDDLCMVNWLIGSFAEYQKQ